MKDLAVIIALNHSSSFSKHSVLEKNKNCIHQLRLVRIMYIKSINNYFLKKSCDEFSK